MQQGEESSLARHHGSARPFPRILPPIAGQFERVGADAASIQPQHGDSSRMGETALDQVTNEPLYFLIPADPVVVTVRSLGKIPRKLSQRFRQAFSTTSFTGCFTKGGGKCARPGPWRRTGKCFGLSTRRRLESRLISLRPERCRG